MFNGVILEVGTIRRIICSSFLLLLFIINSISGSESDNLFNDDSQGDFENLTISAALTNAVENNDWTGLAKNIDSIIKTVGIEELVDSVKEVYEEFCAPMLVEKIVGDFCNGLGVICFETGFSKEAIGCFEIARSICQKYENKQGVYANLINQVFVYLECSDTVVALERVSEVYASLIESDNLGRWEMEKCLELLSGIKRINEGIEDEAHNKITRAIEYYIKDSNLSGEMYSHKALAQILAQQKKPLSEVNKHFVHALIIAVKNDWFENSNDLIETWFNTAKDYNANLRTSDLLFGYVDSILSDKLDSVEIRAKLDFIIVVEDLIPEIKAPEDLLKNTLPYWTQTKNIEKQIEVYRKLAGIFYNKILEDYEGSLKLTIKHLREGLKLSLKSNDWQGIKDILRATYEMELEDSVISDILHGNNDAYKAAIYTITSDLTLQSAEDGKKFAETHDNLLVALDIFERLNDRHGQVYVNLILGDYYVHINRTEAGKYFWNSFLASMQSKEFNGAEVALFKAMEFCSHPDSFLLQLEAKAKENSKNCIQSNRFLLTAGDGLCQNAYYFCKRSNKIFKLCKEVADELNDTHISEINHRIATLNYYTDYPDIYEDKEILDSIRQYHPLSGPDDLSKISYDFLKTLNIPTPSTGHCLS